MIVPFSPFIPVMRSTLSKPPDAFTCWTRIGPSEIERPGEKAFLPVHPDAASAVTRRTARILIAGAGPVGVVTAWALARAGLDVEVFEALTDVDESPRASTTHCATLDLLAANTQRFALGAVFVYQLTLGGRGNPVCGPATPNALPTKGACPSATPSAGRT